MVGARREFFPKGKEKSNVKRRRRREEKQMITLQKLEKQRTERRG